MIRLVRAPNAQLRSFDGSKRIERELLLLKMRRAALPDLIRSDQFASGVWKAAKNSVMRESGGKCGWCEAATSVVAHGDVEHIRPKSSAWWWLAYAYHNYLYSCQICNQSYKGDQYPVRGVEPAGPAVAAENTDAELATMAGTLSPDAHASADAVRAWYELIQACDPLLLDPHIDDPEQFFAWQIDHALLEVWVGPRPELSADDRERAVQTIAILGLNRETLRADRYQRVAAFTVIADSLHAGALPEPVATTFRDQVRAAQKSGAPFAGAVRFLAAM